MMRGCLHLVLFLTSHTRLFNRTNRLLLFESKRDNKKGFELSDRHIHVGNLDWNVPAADILQQLVETTRNVVSIDIKPIDQTRVRDVNKCHGGSAVLEFATRQHAADAIQALQVFSTSQDCNYRLKYAVQRIADPEREPLTASDLKRRQDRAASYARRRVRVAERTDRILERLRANHNGAILQDQVPILEADTLDWSKCPAAIDPIHGGGLQQGSERAARKRASVEAFVSVLQAVLKESPDNNNETFSIADLGCGSGNLALPLQWWLMNSCKTDTAQFEMVAVDYNAHSLERLLDRSKSTNIPVKTVQQDLRHLISSSNQQGSQQFAAVVSLHACGAASDMAMEVAVSRKIPFAISPCCIGKVNKSYSLQPRTSRGMLSQLKKFSYPRSQWLGQAITTEEYQLLAKSADYGVIYDKETDKEEVNRRQRCRVAKQVVEADRLEWAREHGYEVRMVELPRIGKLYPKRELLLGAPKGSHSAERIKELPCLLKSDTRLVI